jgi:eukaryotic-like serine/threonine-protein kinase
VRDVTPPFGPCLSDDDVVAYLTQQGPRDAFERHLDTCDLCRFTVSASLRAPTTPVQMGRFQVLECVGTGASSVVYSAYDPSLDRKVALKVFRVRDANLERVRARMSKEAQAMAKIAHPNVVRVFELVVWEQQLVLAMEFLAGSTLTEWAKNQPWRNVLGAFISAGEGLAAVHAESLLHRDFKPDNVVVTDDGRVLLLDFGLVALLEDAPSGVLSSGTPAFMSPEQLKGEPLDVRADVYSFAAALKRTLPSVPRWLERVISRALSKDKNERHASMPALLAALRHDPRRRWRRALTALALVAAIASPLSVAYTMIVRRAAQCRARAPLSWGDAQRSTLRNKLPRDALATLVLEQLDKYSERFTRTRETLCQDDPNDDRLRCLSMRGVEMSQKISWALGEQTLDGDAAKGLTRLTDPALCATLPRDELERAASPAAEALRKRLVELEATQTAGQRAVALKGLESVREEVSAAESPPLASFFHLLLAETRSMGDAEASLSDLQRALDAADIARDDRRRARVLLRMAYLEAFVGNTGQSVRLVQQGRAVVKRIGGDLELQALAERMESKVAQRRADFAAALAHAELALRALEQKDDRDTFALLPAWVDVCTMSALGGAFEKADVMCHRVIDTTIALYGKEHPSLITPYNNLGCTTFMEGKLEESLKWHDESVRVCRQTFGEDNPRCAMMHFDRARARIANGALDDGKNDLHIGIRALEQAHGGRHVELLEGFDELAYLALLRGESRAASQALDRGEAAVQGLTPDPDAAAILRLFRSALRRDAPGVRAAKDALGGGIIRWQREVAFVEGAMTRRGRD